MPTPDEQERYLNEGRFERGRRRRIPAEWMAVLLCLLFPIPWGPWWLTVLCLVLFTVMVVLLTSRKAT